MSIKTKTKKLLFILQNPSLLKPKSKYIFMLSHMRSRSSLLSHILGSNEAICGYSELHYSYPKKSSLLKMHVELYQDLSCNLNGKYLFDKLLHNSMVLSDEVINHTNAKLVFLLREPESTLKSIINMGDLTGEGNYKDQSIVFDYYCRRLKQLLEYAKNNKNIFFVDSDELVNKPGEILPKLSSWLELDEELTQHYSTFNRTGVVGAGDPSKNIKECKIIQTSQHDGIVLDEKMLNNAMEIYHECREYLVNI
jgi:hypothetical protein